MALRRSRRAAVARPAPARCSAGTGARSRASTTPITSTFARPSPSTDVELGGGGSIQVLTNLRVLGYVFNPVSFWWCRHGDGSLACIVAEVNNTFGERLAYVLLPGRRQREARRPRVFETDKRLHVSPFMPMDQTYTWWFSEPARAAQHSHGRARARQPRLPRDADGPPRAADGARRCVGVSCATR